MNWPLGISNQSPLGPTLGSVSAQLLTVILVVIVALGFDFTNGFHDTGNSMATTIATGALKPRTAVALAAVLNLVGAFLSVAVALTVTNAVVSIQDSNGAPDPALTADHGSALLLIILAGLVGGIIWNLVTWLLGLPSSSSHALFGGLIGATIAGIGWGGVHWTGDSTKLDGVVGKVILPSLASPVIAATVSMVATWLIFRVTRALGEGLNTGGFRWGQIGTGSLMALAHGTNDAQKTMGVITLSLIAYGSWTDTSAIPLWVKVSCAVAIALGTYVGGWRIIRTMGKGITEIEPRQGTAAQGAAAAVILASSQLGFALSTTHVATGSILGSGLGKPGATCAGGSPAGWPWPGSSRSRWRRWSARPPGRSVTSTGGGLAGALVMVAILVVASGLMYARSRRHPITADNVNDDWEARRRSSSRPSRSRPEEALVFSLFLQDIWKVLLYSLLLGAGLPVVYALGVRASALGAAGADGADGADATAVRRRQRSAGRWPGSASSSCSRASASAWPTSSPPATASS